MTTQATTAPDPRERVYRFLLSCMDPARSPAIKTVGLNQCVTVEQSTPLSDRPLPRRATPEERDVAARQLAEEIVSEAEVWATTVPKATVLFTVSAHRSDDRHTAPVSQHPFTVTQAGDFARMEDGDLNYVGAMQRLASDCLRTSREELLETIEGLRADVVFLRKLLFEREQAHEKHLLEREQLLDAKVERDIRIEKERFYLTLQQQGAEVGFKYLVGLLDGKSPKPDGKRAEVRAEDVMRLAQTLTPTQAALAKPLVDAVFAVMSAEEQAELRRLGKLAQAGKLPALNGAAAPEGTSS